MIRTQITFSSGEGGKLTAALKDGGAVTTGQKIAEGANVTFTAAPDSGMSVARWMVDDKPYYWPGTTDLYRESTLTLEKCAEGPQGSGRVQQGRHL